MQYRQSTDRETVGKLVQEILDTIRKPYTEDIVDRVFLAIERNPKRLRRYKRFTKIYGILLNSQIGGLVRQLTGMRNSTEHGKAKSSLIRKYMLLK